MGKDPLRTLHAVLNIQITETCQLKQNPRFGLQFLTLSDNESLRKEDSEKLWVSSAFRLQGAAHVGGMSPPAMAGTPAAGTTL